MDKINVLSVMQGDAIDAAQDRHGRFDYAHVEKLRQRSDAASLAVAELLSADKEFDDANEAWGEIPGPPDGCCDDRDYDSLEFLRVVEATRRRAAAIARCTA